ncbi:MAG: hypothetical protein OM95_08910 [Bdellovibrio sp. ArHS]|nr:MAG: hypothetical protein OM95_08910 [Bdellovibrio sp. ArHS]
MPRIYSFGSGQILALELCKYLGLELEKIKEERFPDGEIKIKPMEAVSSQDVVILHSMAFEPEQTPNDKICELLLFISQLKDEGAGSITAILPYLSYSRSDQKKDFQDPLTLKHLAILYEAAGIEKIITLDVHNLAAYQNAFRCSSVNLEAAPLFCDVIKSKGATGSLVVLSPDIGGIKRAEKFRHLLQGALAKPVAMAFVEKYREKEGLQGQALVGNVHEADIIIYDDMISTGKTVLRAVEAVRKKGARTVTVIATHGLFSENREALLNSSLINELWVTDSNPTLRRPLFKEFPKLKVISCAPLLAQGLGLKS